MCTRMESTLCSQLLGQVSSSSENITFSSLLINSNKQLKMENQISWNFALDFQSCLKKSYWSHQPSLFTQFNLDLSLFKWIMYCLFVGISISIVILLFNTHTCHKLTYIHTNQCVCICIYANMWMFIQVFFVIFIEYIW